MINECNMALWVRERDSAKEEAKMEKVIPGGSRPATPAHNKGCPVSWSGEGGAGKEAPEGAAALERQHPVPKDQLCAGPSSGIGQ